MGHYTRDVFHDIVFLFHMPLFFIISGFLQETIKNKQQLSNKFKKIILPYAVYILIDYLLIKRAFSLSGLKQILCGGRSADGVYWYITCYLAVICLFFLIQKISSKYKNVLVFILGELAVLESNLLIHFSDQNHLVNFLNTTGIPGNIDVALLASVYFAIGFNNKERIQSYMSKKCWQYDVIAVFLMLLFVGFCLWNYKDGQAIYYFDMKPVKYPSYILAIVIPCCVGFIFARVIYWLSRPKWLKKLRILLSYLGQTTLPIMMMHVPLNTLKGVVGYNRLVYVLIGIGIPVIITITLGRFAMCRRLFGLPLLLRSEIYDNDCIC